MSTFGDYKSYKKYEPTYKNWKSERDTADAKRQEYVKRHPEIRNREDIQRGQILMRAIDIMDEYSQKRAEDMEVATESAISGGLELAFFGGIGLGFLVSRIKPLQNFIIKMAKGNKYAELMATAIPTLVGGLVGTAAAFPLMAWGAKAEVAASRKGRFEAMRKELKNPNGFAVLTDEQIAEAKEISRTVKLEDEKKKKISSELMKGLKYIKDMAIDSKEYKRQRKLFELELEQDNKHINDKMTSQEELNAKRDQQLLTKLVEKIDIASQDYAENTELATQTATIGIFSLSALGTLLVSKITSAMKIKNASKISAITTILGVLASLGISIASANIQKQSARVGRYMVKKELMQNPDNLIYVEDAKTGEIKDIQIKPKKKKNLFKFYKEALKNNKEFNKYKKTVGKEEKRFFKATEQLKLTPEQIKDAKRLQKNTFRTFNKIDENSQKYSESVEALGQAAAYPLGLICAGIGTVAGAPFLFKDAKGIKMAENFAKYLGVILLSTIPSIGFSAYINKEQKKASRIADMLAIQEMQDYRKFR